MKIRMILLFLVGLLFFSASGLVQTVDEEDLEAITEMVADDGFHHQLKTKFIEGSAGFMSLVAVALVLGLTLCIERIIYLTLSEINAKKLMTDIEKKV